MTDFPIAEVAAEADAAAIVYGPLTSTHEAYGVLVEEMAELLDAIRANHLAEVRLEALQVAAVALRLAYQASHPQGFAEFVRRSGA